MKDANAGTCRSHQQRNRDDRSKTIQAVRRCEPKKEESIFVGKKQKKNEQDKPACKTKPKRMLHAIR